MDITSHFIFIIGLLLCMSILVGLASRRTGAPLLLAFLGVGLLFGQDGPGGIVFNDMSLSYLICSLSLAVILFDGGMQTPMPVFRYSLRPAIILATVGVLLTAGIAGLGIWYFLDKDLPQAMLLGAIFASTDAAAVFLLLRQRGVRLSPSMSGTLEVESGMNDPMAIFLTLTCVQLIIGYEEADGVLIVGDFLWQMGSGIVAGLVGGKLMRWFFRYAEEASGLNSIFVLSGALMIFGATNMAGGSGFLAVYLAGLMLGNADALPLKPVRQFMDGMGWLSQLVMLLVLGLLATPTELIGDIPAALVIAGLLIFVARPVAVFLSLAFERFNWREKLFISWVGLRGAIPIYLATIPVMMGLEGRYFNLAFIVVICSLFLQGWTIRPVAGLLGVARQPRDQASSGQ